MIYYAIKPKPEATFPSTTPVVVPRLQNKNFTKFMKQHEGVVENANSMMLAFLQQLQIPGHEVKVDSEKLRRMLTNYIYTRS